MSQIWIALIPAFQPEPIFLQLLRELKENHFEIVVVDDGSGSGFSALFEAASKLATVLIHPQNLGKGAALKTGLSHIRNHYDPSQILVTMDADGQHCVRDALRVCHTAKETPDSLILGSRRLTGAIPLRSRFGNGLTRMVYRLSTGLSIHDTQTGLRAFPVQMISELLSIEGQRYEYEMNVLLEFSCRNINIKEIPIETIYIENNASSHFHAVKDSCRIYLQILKFSACSFIGFLLDYGLYALLLTLGLGLRVSNIAARVVSASVNYTLNRKYVFQSSESVLRSALRYFLLAGFILLGNTVVLTFLVNFCGFHTLLGKVLTEILFFLLSWFLQKTVVFKGVKVK